MENNLILEVKKLTKIYKENAVIVNAVNNINLKITKGEFAAIMGPSGSGKSTLLHLIGGLDSPSEGTVIINNTDINKLSDRKLTKFRRTKIGFIFQFFNLINSLTTYENIVLPLILEKKLDRKKIKEMIRFLGLDDKVDTLPSKLSGGEQQRVALARALVGQPALILADEPTGNLDTKSASQIMLLFKKACEVLHQTVVMVTHDPKAAAYAQRIVILKDGQMVDDLKENNGFNLDIVLSYLKKHNL